MTSCKTRCAHQAHLFMFVPLARPWNTWETSWKQDTRRIFFMSQPSFDAWTCEIGRGFKSCRFASQPAVSTNVEIVTVYTWCPTYSCTLPRSVGQIQGRIAWAKAKTGNQFRIGGWDCMLYVQRTNHWLHRSQLESASGQCCRCCHRTERRT